jgi:hypothetical protein
MGAGAEIVVEVQQGLAPRRAALMRRRAVCAHLDPSDRDANDLLVRVGRAGQAGAGAVGRAAREMRRGQYGGRF